MKKLLRLEKVSKTFNLPNHTSRSGTMNITALNNVTLSVYKGEVLGLVGESGCGKTTLGKIATGLVPADSGSIIFNDTDITSLSRRRLRTVRRNIQMVFQDPFSSLNPRMRVGDILAEPFRIHKISCVDIAAEVRQNLAAVGLEPDITRRFPHEFSGGQRQRIGIARALSLKPELIIADEPVSALDLSVQAQIVALLQHLRDTFALTYMFISHDLSVVRQICTRIAVMYLGRIIEIAPASALFSKPQHPYTEMLLQAIPVANPRRRNHYAPPGDVPSASAPPSGCPFHPRCPYATDICRHTLPQLACVSGANHVACHNHAALNLSGW